MAGLIPRLSPAYEVAGTASDGGEGLELIRREKPDLVILDIRMPGMDGLAMLRELRSEGNACRAIVLSAYSDFDYAKTAIDLGVESYILKPVKVRELEDVLRLTQARIRQEEEEKIRYTPGKAFLSALAGEVEADPYVRKRLKEEYGLVPDGLTGIFIIWLGKDYGVYSDRVRDALEPLGSRSGKSGSLCWLLSIRWRIRKRHRSILERRRRLCSPGSPGGRPSWD